MVGFCVSPCRPENACSSSAMLNFSTTPCFTASAPEGGCPSLSSHKLGLLTQRDGVLFRHPKSQLSSHPGKRLPGALHPYAAGRGAVSSASGIPPNNRGAGCPFNPRVFLTGHLRPCFRLYGAAGAPQPCLCWPGDENKEPRAPPFPFG